MSPGDREVHWTLQDWAQPDAGTLVLTLRATDVPLQAQLTYAVDEVTGLLQRRTTLLHTGDGPPLDRSRG